MANRKCQPDAREILQPVRHVTALAPHGVQRGVAARAILPVLFIHGEDVVRVEAAAIHLP